jgi:hypothetical protein
MREEISSLAAGAGEAMEPSARRAGLLPLRAELSSSVFSFRGDVRLYFPY